MFAQTAHLLARMLVVVTVLSKPFRTAISKQEYAKVRALGQEHKAHNFRSGA